MSEEGLDLFTKSANNDMATIVIGEVHVQIQEGHL